MYQNPTVHHITSLTWLTSRYDAETEATLRYSTSAEPYNNNVVPPIQCLIQCFCEQNSTQNFNVERVLLLRKRDHHRFVKIQSIRVGLDYVYNVSVSCYPSLNEIFRLDQSLSLNNACFKFSDIFIYMERLAWQRSRS